MTSGLEQDEAFGHCDRCGINCLECNPIDGGLQVTGVDGMMSEGFAPAALPNKIICGATDCAALDCSQACPRALQPSSDPCGGCQERQVCSVGVFIPIHEHVRSICVHPCDETDVREWIERTRAVVDTAIAISEADLSVYDDVPEAHDLMDKLDAVVDAYRGVAQGL